MLSDEFTTNTTDLVPFTNEKGDYIIKNSDDQVLTVPPEYSSYFIYTVNSFSQMYNTNPQTFWDSIFTVFLNIIEFVMKKEKNMYTQISEIVKKSDLLYSRLLNNITLLQEKYDDKMFDFVFLLPDYFVYACRILADRNVPKECKAEIVLSIIYLISPFDFIPEAIIHHPLAFLDDSFLCLFVAKRTIEGGYIDSKTFLKHWPGRPSAIENFADWYDTIEEVLGIPALEKIWHHLVSKLRGANTAESDT